MRDCPNVEMRDRLPELLHGRSAAAAAEDLSAHLRACEACREELELLRALRGALSVGAAIDVDAVVAALPRQPVRRLGGQWGRRGSVAGLALAAGLAGVMLLDRGPERAPSSGAPGAQTPPLPVAVE